jgi:hypothetical protein
MARLFERVFSARGGAKPGLPVSSAMAVVFRESWSSDGRWRCRRRFGRIGARPLKKQGDLVGFG